MCRNFVLNLLNHEDLPRLFYVDPDKMVQKGEIPWSAKVVPELKTNKNFWVKTVSIVNIGCSRSNNDKQPNRTYYFEDLTGSAQVRVRVKSVTISRMKADEWFL